MSKLVATLAGRLATDPGATDKDLPQAGVLVLLDEQGAEPTVVLTLRAAHMRLHAGEVAFPGGKCDPQDTSHWHTALREAEEETGLPRDAVEQLGVLPSVVTRTGIEVIACVGRLMTPVNLQLNPDELEEVFSVPLSFFAQADQLHLDRFEYRGRSRLVPRYEYKDYSIWGITAAILVKLVNTACDAGLELEDYWLGDS